MNAPRVAPLAEANWTEEHRALMAPIVVRNTTSNIFRTLLRHPAAFAPFVGWASHVLSKANTLSPRLRELAILRTAYLCQCRYVLAQHIPIGRRAGLNDVEIASLQNSGEAFEDAPCRAVILTCDEIHHTRTLSDSSWEELVRHFVEQQRMDLVFTIGQYSQLAMITNSFGIEIDPHLKDR